MRFWSRVAVSLCSAAMPFFVMGGIAGCAERAGVGPTSAVPVDLALRPWWDRSAPPELRAARLRDAMSLDEKLRIVMGYTDPMLLGLRGWWQVDSSVIAEVARGQVPGSAGYVPGIERLGLMPQWQTDASIGVRVNGLERTALPSSLASAASFDPKVTQTAGEMIADEARRSGFNVFLAGGANLAREPRNGRNFEYAGEDPLLVGTMVSGLVRGIQSRHMVSTMKHFALNDQETERMSLDVHMSVSAMRQSDLLPFELILDWAHPGSVMCAYNRVETEWACENDWLLTRVLKQEWGFDGYVMSDWGAVHTTEKSANAGLDQMTGFPCCGDGKAYFGSPLKDAVQAGRVPIARLDDMVYRIVLPFFRNGVFDDPPVKGPIAVQADAAVAQASAEQSLVLLKNDDQMLPLEHAARLAVIGGHADRGVLSGGGSSAVTPVGGNAVPGIDPVFFPGPVVYVPSSPLKALQAALPATQITFADADDVARACDAARRADAAIVFVTQWMAEGLDGSLALDGAQNRLVDAVAQANPNTIVVIESGGAVLMPWLPKVKAVLEAFYPGARGGEAIANILTGRVNPSGHLPITFPASEAQLPHELAGKDKDNGIPPMIFYDEGAAVGYKWFELTRQTPLFAFGHGLSYTRFAFSGLSVEPKGDRIHVSLEIRNAGARQGAALAQVYAVPEPSAGWEAPRRLVGFSKVLLDPGATRRVEVTIDPRLMAVYNESRHCWTIAPGQYRFQVAEASDGIPLEQTVVVPGHSFPSGKLGK